MSMYPVMSSAATDECAVYPDGVTLAQEPGAVQEKPKKARRHKGPEFYKPFHYLLLVYLFFYCSRIPELVPWFHIGLLLQPILLVGMVMTGTTKTLFRTDVGRMMTAFTIWITISVPFSTWRGGSFNVWLLAVQALALLFFMASFIRTLEDCYRVMYTMALAGAAVGVLSFLIGGVTAAGSDRLGLGNSNDTLRDANLLALYLVTGLPFLYFASTWKKGFVKIGLIVMILPVLAGMAKTGSRMGMLAVALGLLFFLIHATASQRAFVIFGGFVFLFLAVALLPHNITERFTILFQPASKASEEAAESSEARKTMLLRSIEMTFEHPLLGVGPGEFMDAEAAEDMAVGKRGLWHYTHNAYTELSSETGILGMVLFLIAFWRCFRGLTPLRKRFPIVLVRRAALCIQIAILVSAVGAFFLSIAYSGILYPIMGISAAFQLAAARRQKEMKAEAEAAPPGQSLQGATA